MVSRVLHKQRMAQVRKRTLNVTGLNTDGRGRIGLLPCSYVCSSVNRLIIRPL